MKRVVLLLLVASFSHADRAGARGEKVLIIDPDRDGGFENGTTLEGNGWVAVNGNETDQWVAGTAPIPIESRCAFLSTDGGTTWGHHPNVASVVHVYKEVFIPFDATEMYLSFEVKGITVDGARLKVYLVPPSIPLVAGGEVSGEPVWERPSVIVPFWIESGVIPLFPLPGTFQRLVFSWVNAGIGANVFFPVAVDAIEVSYTRRNPLIDPWTFRSALPQTNNLLSFLALDATTALVSGESGTVGKTTDGGTTWEFQHNLLGFRSPIVSLAPFAGDFYGVAQPRSLLHSSDDGGTWTIRSTIGSGNTVNAIASHGNWIIGVTDSGEIYKSNSPFTNWQLRFNGTTERITSITKSPDGQTLYVASAGGGVWKTLDQGNTWNPVLNTGLPPGQSINDILIDPLNPDIVTIGHSSGLFRSTTGGTDFALVTGSFGFVSSLAINPSSPTNGFAVGAQGRVFSTSNRFTDVTSTTTGMIDWHRDGTYYIGTSDAGFVGNAGTMFNRPNNGQTVTRTSSGTRNGFRGFDFVAPPPGEDPAIGYAATAGIPGALLKTTDGGRIWNSLVLPGPSFLLNAVTSPTDSNVLAMGTLGRGVRSTNGGATLTTSMLPQPLEVFGLYSYYFNGVLTAIGVGFGGDVWITTDWGLTWTPQPSGILEALFSVTGTTINLSQFRHIGPRNNPGGDSLVLTAVGQNGRIIQSTNGGASWVTRPSPTTSVLLDVQFVTPQVGHAVGHSGTLVRTSDGGETWTQITVGTAASINAVSFIGQDIGVIVTSDGMILRTLDGAVTWDTLGSTTTNSLTDVVMLDPYTAIAGGANGTILMAEPDSVILVSVDDRSRHDHVPGGPVLHHNYPNPFNPSTTIQYELPTAARVTLTIFDLVGRSVMTIAEGEKRTGRHEFLWHGADESGRELSSGMYFYQLEVQSAGNRKLTLRKKMLLLK